MRLMNQITEVELKNLGKNIKRLRKSLGMNQTALATQASTRPTTISMLENGLNPNPGWDLLDRVSRVLKTSIHQLTMPPTSTVSQTDDDMIPPDGLVDLMLHEERFLHPSEDRISLEELQWLKRLPVTDDSPFIAEEYLLILRHFRILRKFKSR